MIIAIGSVCFGLVAGYLTYRTLIRAEKSQVSDLAAVLSAIGGGATTALFAPGTDAFGWYAIGLAVGMVVYIATFSALNGRAATSTVLGGKDDAPR